MKEPLRIAVVDVAAEKTGALSVLVEFYRYVRFQSHLPIEWYFFTSVVDLEETECITIIKNPAIKQGWINRILWEYTVFPRSIKSKKIDLIFSLQNKALPGKKIPQVVYFHNALHLLKPGNFHFFDSFDKKVYIYRFILTPVTLHSLKRADRIITQTESVKEELQKRIGNKPITAIYPDVKVKLLTGENKLKGFIYPSLSSAYKRHDLIISAVEKAGKQFDGEILFTMSGQENKAAEKIAKRCVGITNIMLTGFLEREKLIEKYREYGLIFASETESFPIPFIEAMAFGTPIIAREVPYAKEILSKYENKYLYQDVFELVEILSNWKEMKRKDGVKAEESPSWEKIVHVLLDTIKRKGSE